MTARRRLTAILAADVVGYTLKPLSICWSELCRNWAKHDSDFEPLRNHPRFQQLFERIDKG